MSMEYDEFERELRSAFAEAIKEADKTQYQIGIRPDCIQWEIFCVTAKNKYMLGRSIPLEVIRRCRYPDILISEAVQSALKAMAMWERWKEKE